MNGIIGLVLSRGSDPSLLVPVHFRCVASASVPQDIRGPALVRFGSPPFFSLLVWLGFVLRGPGSSPFLPCFPRSP